MKWSVYNNELEKDLVALWESLSRGKQYALDQYVSVLRQIVAANKGTTKTRNYNKTKMGAWESARVARADEKRRMVAAFERAGIDSKKSLFL